VFIVIGENIHTTRVLSRKSQRLVDEGNGEWIAFVDCDGRDRRLRVPGWFKQTQDWVEGRLKHIAIAVQTGLDGGVDAADAVAYLRKQVQQQVDTGASYLDLNVDELSPRLGEQVAAMRWLVGQVQSWTDLPVSIDSSHADIIGAGLAAARPGSKPLLNSASLERRSALDLAVDAGGPVIVTAAGASGMPSNADQRVDNASRMLEAALDKGILLRDVFVDVLIFPVSVDGAFGRHALEAIRRLRERYGHEMHITGGMSNVSFGIPGRRLLNAVFLRLAIDAGADSGIVDPVAVDLDDIRGLDLASGPYAIARDALLGVDLDCREFLRAYRSGEFAAFGVSPPVRNAR
jgi:5-methyltetrahydrofolate--homocysteine methyltransferase